MENPCKVSLAACENYEPALLTQAVERLWTDLSLDAVIKPGQKFVLKPNLLLKKKPEEAATTHPEVVAAVIQALKRRGVAPGDITIADSPGGPYNALNLRGIYGASGMAGVAAREGVNLNLDFSYHTVNYPEGRRCKQFEVIDPVRNADVIINISKLKTHGMMTLSACVKNMFGSIPGLLKPEMHYRFPDWDAFGEMLCDLCTLTAPRINIIDGIWGMEGNGPSGGTPRHMGVLLASENPFAADVAACRVVGLTPAEVPYLKAALGRGILREEDVAYSGDTVERFAVPDFRMPDSKGVLFARNAPPFVQNILKKVLTPRPVIREATCIGCGKCAESCPRHTIAMKKDGKGKTHAVIRYNNCIKCYCCHEMCPAKSIDIQGLRVLGRAKKGNP